MAESQTSFLTGLVSPQNKGALSHLGARDLDELLRIPPRRYVTPGPLSSLRLLREGDDVTVIGTVSGSTTRRMSNRPGHVLSVTLRDDDGDSLPLTFFLFKDHLVSWHLSRLIDGARVLVSGTVSEFRGDPQIAHPDYLLLPDEPSEDDARRIQEALEPAPVYPLRAKLAQKQVRKAFHAALKHAETLEDPIPTAMRAERGVGGIVEAVRHLHEPATMDDVAAAHRYMRYEEAFLIQSIFARRRAQDASDTAPSLATVGPLTRGLDDRLPFTLTPSQSQVGEALAERIAGEHPTSVLLQGDVGSGKTIVALRAMVRAVDSGYQAALLAPTEVLARQHFATITHLLGSLARAGHLDADPNATRVHLIVGSSSVPERRRTLTDLMTGEAGIVVGTHALLTDTVEFYNLGLVVVDEQHRFGVDHRRSVRAKGPQGMRPHMMVMTATPIPRTAAMSLVGDLDSLTLESRPHSGSETSSFVVPFPDASWRERMWQRLFEEVRSGRQAFVVCPRIDGRDTEDEADGDRYSTDSPTLHTVVDVTSWLREHPGADGVRIEELHGRLTTDEKKDRMAAFAAGEINVLVATTVIEVGVDVPNASVMVVLDAERFGLAQLHQLRGRIGRGQHPGIAFFATAFPRGSDQHSHLTELANTTDGFALAELDLARRGSGDLVGDVQSGAGVAVRYLDVARDAALIEEAREDAFLIEAMRLGNLAYPTPPSEEEFDALGRAIARRTSGGHAAVERS